MPTAERAEPAVESRWQPARVAACMAIASALLALPALTGSWVCDDHTMLGNAAMDGPEDLLLAFQRNSDAYMDPEGKAPGLTTYRPLPMLSLILPLWLFGEVPWPNHLLSWLLHAATILGLSLSLRNCGRARWWIVGGFALHPVTLEAYGWINGRSDVLAGALLATCAVALRPPGDPGRHAGRAMVLGLATALGMLCKVTFLPAVVCVTVAVGGWKRGDPDRLDPIWASVGLAGGLAAATLTRAAFDSSGLELSAAPSPLALLDPQRMWRLLALAAQTLLLPQASSMRTLAWELAGPSAPAAHACLVGLAACWIGLLSKRQWRAALLIGGAAATVLPALAVQGGWWMGFDRYLYMPLLLLALAAGEALQRRPQSGLLPDRAALAAALFCLVWLGSQSWVAATYYEGEVQWFSSMVEQRPDDPSGALLAAGWFHRQGRPQDATRALESIDPSQLPLAAEHALARAWHELKRADRVIPLLERSYARAPEDPFVQLDIMGLRASQGRLDESLAIAGPLAKVPGFCQAVRYSLRGWLEEARTAQDAELADTLARAAAPLPCAAPSDPLP